MMGPSTWKILALVVAIAILLVLPRVVAQFGLP